MLIRAIHQVGDVAVGLMDRGHVVEELCLRVTLERKVLGALDALVLELAKGMVEVGEPIDQPFAHQSLQVLLHALHLHHDRARGHVVCHREKNLSNACALKRISRFAHEGKPPQICVAC